MSLIVEVVITEGISKVRLAGDRLSAIVHLRRVIDALERSGRAENYVDLTTGVTTPKIQDSAPVRVSRVDTSPWWV